MTKYKIGQVYRFSCEQFYKYQEEIFEVTKISGDIIYYKRLSLSKDQKLRSSFGINSLFDKYTILLPMYKIREAFNKWLND